MLGDALACISGAFPTILIHMLKSTKPNSRIWSGTDHAPETLPTMSIREGLYKLLDFYFRNYNSQMTKLGQKSYFFILNILRGKGEKR